MPGASRSATRCTPRIWPSQRDFWGCALALISVAPPELEFHEIDIKDLPLYSSDYDADFPPAGRALKDAIDWGSRPWGTNSFARKPTGIIGASPGGIGTAVMQSSMRSVLSFLDAPQLNAPEAYIRFVPEAYDDDGSVTTTVQ